MALTFRDDRQCRALTGLPIQKLDALEEAFSRVYYQLKQAAYENQKAIGKRQRKPGGGRKGALPSMREKLIFVLYYLKVYPTYDGLATQFGMARSKAHENLHKLAPILYQTLVELEVLPARQFTNVDEFRAALAGETQLLIDVTERAYRRQLDDQLQRQKYSGKKKDIPSKTLSSQRETKSYGSLE